MKTIEAPQKEPLYFYYVECPKSVRVVSKRLCLDHTFDPFAEMECKDGVFSIEDAIILSQNPYIDKVMMLLDEEQAYCIMPIENEKIWVSGWQDASMFEPHVLPEKSKNP